MSAEARDVTLAIPAKAGYLVLARLALAAVCRLTSLTQSDVADLKLAVTEAARDFVITGADEMDDDDHDGERIDFAFDLSDGRLTLELAGGDQPDDADDRELRHAIIEATVDEVEFTASRTTLVKYLD